MRLVDAGALEGVEIELLDGLLSNKIRAVAHR